MSIGVAIKNTDNTDVDIITGSFYSRSLQFTDALSAAAYWLLTTWWLGQGLYIAGKLSTRGVYYTLPVTLHQKPKLDIRLFVDLAEFNCFYLRYVYLIFHNILCLACLRQN